MKNWNARYREYCEVLSCRSDWDLKEVCRIYGEICVLREERDLNFGERMLLEHAKDILEGTVQVPKTRGHLQVFKGGAK